MLVFSSDRFDVPLPAGHRFPMAKFRLLRESVESSGLVPDENLRVSPAASDDQLRLVHTMDYVEAVTHGKLSSRTERRIGFPWSAQLVERSRRSVGGTIAACYSAVACGFGVNLAGGTHHAFADRGEGFCVFNDVAVAARILQRESRVRTVLVLDCDVHQGNGTAAIFHGDASVFTCSLHGRRNFPYRKERSDLDIELEDGTGDDQYLAVLASLLEALDQRVAPDLVVYLAGADPFAEDRWGRLSLSAVGLAARDRMVLGHYRARGIGVAVAMAGGYARDPRTVADLHLQTVAIAAEQAGMPSAVPAKPRRPALDR